MSDVIEIRELRCSAVVGVLDEERLRPQPLVFDITIERPFAAAAKHDDLTSTTNYAAVLDLAGRIATEGRFQLLETLAHRVAQAVLDADPEVSEVTVAVRKVRPPVPEDVSSVGVRSTLRRSE